MVIRHFLSVEGFRPTEEKTWHYTAYSITGDKLSTDNNTATEYLEGYKICHHFFCVLTAANVQGRWMGLHFKSTKSYIRKEEKSAPGFEMDKQHLTVLACCGACATNKLPLLVNCFHGVSKTWTWNRFLFTTRIKNSLDGSQLIPGFVRKTICCGKNESI